MGISEVQIRATHIIKPAEKTWTGTMKLSAIDVEVGRGFVPMVYLYNPNNKGFDAASVSRTVSESLGKVLVHFYPFAGRLRPTGGGVRTMELVLDDAADTWGVPLVDAEAAVEVADFGDDLVDAEEKGRFHNLLPAVGFMVKRLPELPLLAVQLTHFRCGGVAVGVCWSHAVADGIGAGQFYSAWTRLARGEPLGISPLHDRALLIAGEPPRSVPQLSKHEAAPPPPPAVPLPTDDSGVDKAPPPMAMPPPTFTLKLPVSKQEINKLKQIAGDVGNGRSYSRYEVLTAHAWRCASKARGYEGKRLNVLGIAVDFRKRLTPQIPPTFCGNATIIMTATSESKDLNSNPLGYACSRIRQTIEKVSDDFVWASVDYLRSLDDFAWRGLMTPEGLFVNPDVMMPCWQNLSFNNLDFGWGNEIHMASSPPPLEGMACLRDGHEEGSAIVVMCLQVAHVDKFKEYFFNQLK